MNIHISMFIYSYSNSIKYISHSSYGMLSKEFDYQTCLQSIYESTISNSLYYDVLNR